MLRQHLVYAVRTMRQSVAFSAAVVLTIALAIAGNTVVFSIVNAGYFKAMNIPLLLGREFTDGDAGLAQVVILGQSAAKKLFGGAEPLGRTITGRTTRLRSP